MFLVKYGTKEHLEMLANGIIYFNQVSKYREDGTAYRGDKNEGRIPIDPTKIKLFDNNGNNIFEDFPLPDSVMQPVQGDDDVLMFCASAITKEVLNKRENGYIFSEEYKEAINHFGEYALLFKSNDFLHLINEAQQNTKPEFGYIGDFIIYRNLDDFSDPEEHRKSYKGTGSFYDRFFVKSINYSNQNEWRLIIDGSEEALPVDQNGAFKLTINKLNWSLLNDTETFLHSVLNFD